MYVSSLFIYPIKSLQGIAVPEIATTDRGALHDRRWMLVDAEGRFVSQRTTPELVHFRLEMDDGGIKVSHPKAGQGIEVPISISAGALVPVGIWKDESAALEADQEVNNWFSKILGQNLRLVFMPENVQRPVDTFYAKKNELVSFADGFPYLVIGQSSLDDLNNRLEAPVPMDRFRPNIVFEGGLAFSEDKWNEVRIGSATFKRVKPCARCLVITTDQKTGQRGQVPLRTLNTYRKAGNAVNFGQNLLCVQPGTLRINDKIRNL